MEDIIMMATKREGGEDANFCRVTVTDLYGGRGHDFEVKDKVSINNGGMLVVATSIPNEREWIQWKGRTARQDKPGAFWVVLNKKAETNHPAEKARAKKVGELTSVSEQYNVGEPAGLCRCGQRGEDQKVQRHAGRLLHHQFETCTCQLLLCGCLRSLAGTSTISLSSTSTTDPGHTTMPRAKSLNGRGRTQYRLWGNLVSARPHLGRLSAISFGQMCAQQHEFAVTGAGVDYSADDTELRDFLQHYRQRVDSEEYEHDSSKPMSITTILKDPVLTKSRI
jgi:hypothetical protein